MDPINYTQDIATPFQSAMQGFQAGTAIQDTQFKQRAREFELQQVQQQQQAAIAQQQQQREVINGLLKNPSASGDDYARAMVLVPGLEKQFKQAWEIKSKEQQQALLYDLSQWGAAIENGKPEVTSQAIRNRADATEAKNGVTPETKAWRAQADSIDADPEFSGMMIKGMLAAHPDGKAVIDGLAALAKERRDAAKGPADLMTAKAEAKIKSAQAGVAVPMAQAELESKQATTDKTISETQIATANQLNKMPGIDIPESARKIVNDSALAAQTSREFANKAEDLATQILAADPASFLAGTQEWLKKATGNQGYISQLRNETNRMLAGDAMRTYRAAAPGNFSDSDLKQAMTGLPDENAPPAMMASYLRGVAKVQRYYAQIEDARAEWISQVGSPYKSNKDIEVTGIRVPRGTTFNEFIGKSFKPVGSQTQPEVSNDAASRLMQKYGGGSGGATGSY